MREIQTYTSEANGRIIDSHTGGQIQFVVQTKLKILSCSILVVTDPKPSNKRAKLDYIHVYLQPIKQQEKAIGINQFDFLTASRDRYYL
jgi:hypothetical protein